MKKLVFMFVACATMSLAVSFSSCGSSEKAADSVDSDSVAAAQAPETEEVAGDSVDTTATETVAEDSVAA